MSDIYNINECVTHIGADLTSAIPVGQVTFSRPFPAYPHRRISQRYAQLIDYRQPLPLGSFHPTYTYAVLTEETESTEIGGGICEWSRVYHEVPATLTEYTTSNFTFPALYNGNRWLITDDGDGDDADGDAGGDEVVSVENINAKVRNPYTKGVIAKQVMHFYNLDTHYYMPNGDLITQPSDLPLSDAFLPILTTSGFPAGVDYCDNNTSPSYTTYVSYISNGTYLQIGDAEIERWEGNIYMVKFTYSKAF